MKYILTIVFVYYVYHLFTGGVEAMTAREIDPSCDVVMFTTPSCPYCKKARDLMDSRGQQWCEKDISNSKENRQIFKSIGGKGVPVTVFADLILHGYRESNYIAALNSLSYKL